MWRHAVFQHGGFYSNGNQYSFMQASFYIIGCNGFSMNFSIRSSSAWWSRARMVHVTALDIQVNLRNLTPCWRAAWHQCTHSIQRWHLVCNTYWHRWIHRQTQTQCCVMTGRRPQSWSCRLVCCRSAWTCWCWLSRPALYSPTPSLCRRLNMSQTRNGHGSPAAWRVENKESLLYLSCIIHGDNHEQTQK